MIHWQNMISCKKFFIWSEKKFNIFLITGSIILCIGWFAGLFIAPTDIQQQDAYRIMFIHVPAASGGMTIYFGISICAILSLIWRIKLADVILTAYAPLGATLTFIALITGAIWGKPMWGTWWVWDARLTSCLILFLFYLGIIILRYVMNDSESAAKGCALLTIIGAIDLPIVHYSVNWWNTLHQKASILALQKPTIDFSMLWPLLLSMLGLALFIIGISFVKMRTIILQRFIQQQYIKNWLRSTNENSR